MTDIIKLAILGNGGAGKSALTVQYAQNTFIEQYDPTIEDSYRKLEMIEGVDIVLEIIDTAGTEQFTAMRDLYIGESHAFMVCFSLVDHESWIGAIDCVKLIKAKRKDPVSIIIIGMKKDLLESQPREVAVEEIQQFLGKDFKYFEISAKDNDASTEPFIYLAKVVLQSRRNQIKKNSKSAKSMSLPELCRSPDFAPCIIKKRLRTDKSVINDFDESGISPLQAALARPESPQRTELLKILKSYGADATLRSPSDCAIWENIIQAHEWQQLSDLLEFGYVHPSILTNKLEILGGSPSEYILKNCPKEIPSYLLKEIIKASTESASLSALACRRLNRSEIEIDFNKVLGKGGFSTVFKGKFGGQDVAIKRLNESEDPNSSFFDLVSLRRELAILNLLRGSGLLEYYGYCYEEPYYYIVTELADTALKSYLRTHKQLSWAKRIHIAMEIAKGMNQLHDHSIAHRDLKTENVLLMNPDSEYPVVKVADFGISRPVTNAGVSTTFSVGTPCYMAPEVLGGTTVSAGKELLKSDVYSFGYVLWVLVSGQEPHEGETTLGVIKIVSSKKKSLFSSSRSAPLKIPADWPKDWKKLISSCWEVDPNRRPSFESIVNILIAFRKSYVGNAPPEPEVKLNVQSPVPLTPEVNSPARQEESEPQPISPIEQWLHDNHLSEYTPKFLRHRITLKNLGSLKYEYLADMGISEVGSRLDILQAISDTLANQ